MLLALATWQALENSSDRQHEPEPPRTWPALSAFPNAPARHQGAAYTQDKTDVEGQPPRTRHSQGTLLKNQTTYGTQALAGGVQEEQMVAPRPL